MASRTQSLLRIFVNNKIGVILGIAYSIFSFASFFWGLGYGASCPEAGPDVCDNPPFYVAIASSFYTFVFILPHMITWSLLFYIGQQLTVLINPSILTASSLDFMPLFVAIAVVTSAVWAFIGAHSERLIKNTGKA